MPAIASRAAARIRSTGERVVRAAERRRYGLTGRSARFWGSRHLHEPGIFDGWWSTAELPYRAVLVDAVAALEPASVLEVGCGVGVNLHLIHQRLPDVRLAGVDVNAAAVDYARQRVAAELAVADATMLPFPDRSFDVAVTAATLCCIGPDRYPEAAAELRRVARNVILVETNEPAERLDVYPNTDYWARDYTIEFPGATVDELADPSGHMRHLVRAATPPI